MKLRIISTWKTANHIAHVTFVLHSAMKHTCRPIKTHVLSKLFYKLESKSRAVKGPKKKGFSGVLYTKISESREKMGIVTKFLERC